MNIVHLFIDTITVQSATGSDSSGSPTFGAQRSIKGKVKSEFRKVATASGDTVQAVDVFMTDQPLTQGDRYWVGGADPSDDEQARRLGMVTSMTGLTGAGTLYKADLR